MADFTTATLDSVLNQTWTYHVRIGWKSECTVVGDAPLLHNIIMHGIKS